MQYWNHQSYLGSADVVGMQLTNHLKESTSRYVEIGGRTSRARSTVVGLVSVGGVLRGGGVGGGGRMKRG